MITKRQMTLPKILIVSLGGTITMTRSGMGGIVPTLSAADLVGTVPDLEAVADLVALTPLRKPSASLTLDDLLAVARLLEDRLADDIDGAVVVQGTDTIEETAFVLDRVVESDKPVVVTGAMRGPESAGADGPGNILAATIVAASRSARARGTLVVLNDEIHAALFVQKAHTALPSAFRSPLFGPVGFVIEGTAQFHARTPRAACVTGPFAPEDQPVALLKIGLGDDGRLLRALPSLGYAGVVIDGMGVGHVPQDLAPLISEVLARMPLVIASRVDTGPVFTRTYGFPGSEIDLASRGVIAAGDLSGLKARLLLMLLLRAGRGRDAIANAFQRAS